MNRLRLTTVLLVVVFCLLPIISILMIHHLTLSDTLSKMGTGSFGESYSCISIKNSNYEKEVLVSALKHMKTDFALCLDKSDENGTVRGIYFNKKYANLPMESGRFFKSSDFVKDNYVAVIGKEKKAEVYIKDNNQYIDVYGKEYFVLGIIGYQNETVLDNDIFINIFTDLEEPGNLYLIDYMSDRDAEGITEKYVDLLFESEIDARIIINGENYSESIMPSIVASRWFIGLLISCVICLTLISVQWINYQKIEICIRRLIGASIQDVIILILGKYMIIAFISFAIGFLYCNIFYPAYFNFLVKGYAVCALFIVFFILWSIWILLREPIEEAIK